MEEKKQTATVEKIDTNRLLPIGTVVKLKNIDKEVMIYGRKQTQSSTKRQYDYVAVPYPEGNISEDYNVFFNRNMIKKVLYKGYETKQEIELREKIEKESKQ
ncbi:DUF4176 domain-containing protein [Fictibacillus sp. Mic-4]